MNFKRLLLFLIAPLAVMMNSCVTPVPEYSMPAIAVTDTDGNTLSSIMFENEGGNASFTITATRSWEIISDADWLAVNPLKCTNSDLSTKVTDVTITAAPNEGSQRSVTLKIKMESLSGEVVVTQAGVGQVALGDVLYFDNFDKGGQAQKGSSGWDTYMDQAAGQAFCNPTPENQSGVTYTGTKLTVRSNSSNGSAGTHSNYNGSGVNYLWFGTAPTNLTVGNISLEKLEGNALTLSFGTERYEYEATDNTYKPEEFHVFISGDGEKWSEVSYHFAEDANTNGKWNEATAQFNLKEVPEKLHIYMTATVGAAYAVDDIKLTAGGGGDEIDLAAGVTIDGINIGGGTSGGGQGNEPDPNAVVATVQQFLDAAEDDTVYLLTGTISGNVTSHYGNFDLTDATGTVYVYGLVDSSNTFIWDSLGLQVGDTITIQGTRTSYNGTAQMKNALYISHVKGEGNEEPDQPVVADGPYASDATFVCSKDDSTNANYTLGSTTIDNYAVTGFKLGKSKQEGKFTSAAIGVSGDKYLNFYAAAWKGSSDVTLYYRVDGGEVKSQPLVANAGATGNAPYPITFAESDHYSVLLTGLTANSTIEFGTNANFALTNTYSGSAPDIAPRVIVCGVKLTDEPLGENSGTTEPEQPENPEPEEPEQPEDPEQPESGVATIASVLALGQGATVSSAVIEGVVISNMDLNNLTSKKGLYVQDATAGLQFYLAANHEFKFGDKVQIDLSGASIGAYNGAVQISGLALDKITVLSSGNAVEAKTVTMADFLANKYEGQYIALEGVQVAAADLTKTWSTSTSHTSINMEDANGNSFVVFSSKYATYGTETVAQGSGTIKGIASINNGTIQLIFAQQSDYAALTGERFGATSGDDNTGDDNTGDDNTGDEPAVVSSATISFADTANRTSFSGAQQVWQQNGITVTNNKASSTNDVADYSNPVRLYAGSSVTIEAEKSFSKLVFHCAGSKNLSLSDGTNYTVSGSGSTTVTVTFTTPVTSFVIEKLTAQVRLSSIDVYFAE